MNPYLLPPLLACITCCMLSVAILSRGAHHRPTRLAGALTLAAAFWALCETLWTAADDPGVVLRLVKLAALGWMFIGPINLHLFLELTGHPARRRSGALLAMYGSAVVLVPLGLFTRWVDVAAVPTAWGWGYEVGPLFPVAYLFAAGTFFAGLVLGIREFRHSIAPGERHQAQVLLVCMLLGCSVASVTDGIFPYLGQQVPRLGVLAITFFAMAIAWGFQRYGYSLLGPGVFASEIFSTLPDGVALLRLDGRIRIANPGMERLAGVPPGMLESRPIAELIEGAGIDTPEEITERECMLHGSDGGVVPVAISTSLLRDKRQGPLGLVLVVRDLREVASLRSRLVISDRLAAVGQLAAGIAHEINNPVAFVRANLGALTQLLETVGSKLPSELSDQLQAGLQEGHEVIEESLEGIERVAEIVRGVMDFSHTGDTKHQRVDLNTLLDSALRVSATQLPAGCVVAREYGEIPPVLCAPQELKQVFLNLIINAAQAIDPGEDIRLATCLEAERVVVLVEDEGCGMSPEVLARVFDPFFTTKPVGKGTGLGLSISYQIVRSHGGELSVESEPGRGTCFRVELPVAPALD